MSSTRLSRKQFLGIGAGAAGMMLAGGIPSALAAPRTSFSPYMMPLPIPPKATPVNPTALTKVYRIAAQDFAQRMHPKLPAVNVWGYSNGPGKTLYLGPTIEVHKDDTTQVQFTNEIDSTQHPLPVDPALLGGRGAGPRILTHLHGGFVLGDDDGNPFATTTEVTKGGTQTVTYPPQPRATTLWYHDHALGMTRLNVYAGLAGFFLVRDAFDTGLDGDLPGTALDGKPYEIPIVLQDKKFSNGQFFYSPTATWIPEFFGDTILINGAVQPFLTVEPRMYRLRFLNGSQSRFYHFNLAGGPPLYQIGSEGGMFNAPVAMRSILLLPGERADVLVDFGGFDGQDLVLRNNKLPAGVVSPATPNLPSLMQFRVRGPVTNTGPQEIPALPGEMANVTGTVVENRYITLEEVLDPAGNPVQLQINGRMFDEPVDERPSANTTEDWFFVNVSADTHPMHMHLTNFQVLGRRALDTPAYLAALATARANKTTLPNNTIDPTQYFVAGSTWVNPAANELGWKDTVGAHPNQVTWIRQRFDLPSEVSGTQKYVYHCHILEHEDNDMMRPYEVV